MSTAISFQVSRQDFDLIDQIARRAAELAVRHGLDPSYCSINELRMDVTAAHANGCPLRLAELAKADDGNLGHDVFGIRRHLNRNTGQLGGCFLPRFASRAVAAEAAADAREGR